MRFLASLSLLFSLCVTWAQDVLEPGEPPLTSTLVSDYTRFIQWTLDTPLTVAQEERIKNHLVAAWQANDRKEIERTLNLLELRSQIAGLKLEQDPVARRTVQRDALNSWDRTSSSELARLGVSIFDASHKVLVGGPPPMTKQMQDAFVEMGTFIVTEAIGPPPTRLDVEERVQLYETLATQYPALSAEQKANFARLPALWLQLRRAWPSLNDPEKAALRADWKARLTPKAQPSKPPAKPGAKPTAKPTPPPPVEIPFLSRLKGMSWMYASDAFGKLTAIGGEQYAYGTGW